jgi:hypothetical protein
MDFTKQIWCRVGEWIHQTRNRNQWRAIADIEVPYKAIISWLLERLSVGCWETLLSEICYSTALSLIKRVNKRSRHTGEITAESRPTLAASTVACDMFTMSTLDTNMKSLSCNRVTDLLKFEVPYWHVYVLGPAYFVWPWKSSVSHVLYVTSHRGHCPLLIRISCNYVTHFEASRNVILHTRYVSTCVGAGCGRGRGTKKKSYPLWRMLL